MVRLRVGRGNEHAHEGTISLGNPKSFWFLENAAEDKIARKMVESIDQQNSCLCHKKMISEARICPICLAGKSTSDLTVQFTANSSPFAALARQSSASANKSYLQSGADNSMNLRFFLKMATFSVTVVLVLTLSCFLPSVYAAVLGIKVGPDNTRVSAIIGSSSKGKIEIVLNEEGSRYTPTALSFREKLPVFGSRALSYFSRSIGKSFVRLFSLLGRPFSDPYIQKFSSRFDLEVFPGPSEDHYTFEVNGERVEPEFLSSLFLSHVKDFSAKFAQRAIRDCVIAVPSSYTTQQRESLLLSAQLADLNVLSLIDEVAAAGLFFASTFDSESPQTYLLFHCGSESCTAALLTLTPNHVVNGVKALKVHVSHSATDETVGGFQFDEIIASSVLRRSLPADSIDALPAAALKKALLEASRVKKAVGSYPLSTFYVSVALKSIG